MNAGESRYPETYARWQRDGQAFWAEAARDIDWYEVPKRIFDPNAGVYGRWFADGSATPAECRRSPRHARRGPQPAIVYDSPLAGTSASSPTTVC